MVANMNDASLKQQNRTANQLAAVNAVLGYVAVRQNKKLNASMQELLSTSKASKAELEKISRTQGLVLEELRAQSARMNEQERREQYERVLKQLAYELLTELKSIQEMQTNLEKYLNAKAKLPQYMFFRSEIKNLTSVEEKERTSEALSELTALANAKDIVLSDEELLDINELEKLEKRRSVIVSVRNTGQEYRKKIQRLNNLKSETLARELGVKQKSPGILHYWQGFALLVLGSLMQLTSADTLSLVSLSVGAVVILLRLCSGLFGIRKKAISSSLNEYNAALENASQTEVERLKSECDAALKKHKKPTGILVTFDDYSDFTKKENSKLTQEFKQILTKYPSLTFSASKA